MSRGMIVSAFIGVWLGWVTVAAAELPLEIQVDRYLLEARVLSEEKDHRGALEAMDRVVALQKEHDLNLPEAFSFQYAQTALAAGEVQAAIESVKQYLSAAGREGKYYREALELLVKAERRLQEPNADRAETGLAEPEVKPQPQAVLPSLPQTQEIAKAQPAVDCRKWNTKKFFRKATVEEVNACLGAGSDPMARGKSKNTPLHYAAIYNENPAVVEALLKAGADPNARNKWGSTPLHLAVGNNENPTIIKALLNAGADVNARDRYGHAPLHAAVGRAAGSIKNDTVERRSKIIGILIDAGGDLNARTNSKRFTPLHYAAWLRVDRMVQTLVDAGADLTALDKDNNTPRDVGGRKEKKILDDAWRKLPESQKMAHRARVRRKEAGSGPSFLDVAVGVAGGAAIAAAGGGTEEAVEAGTVFAEGVISGQSPAEIPDGSPSSTPIAPEGSSSEFGGALRDLENSCGERYRSGFSEQDHGRFYCLDAFARHCALKKGPNQQQLAALRHDFEVLRSQGLESRCPYFGVLGGTYDENQTIPGVPESVTEEKATVPATQERRLPTCADGETVPIAVAEGRKPGCPPQRWCSWNACRDDECRRRYRKCEPGVLQ